MTLTAVADAGPIIHLAEIDSLELLAAPETLLIPETVYQEVDTGGVPAGLGAVSYELVEADREYGRNNSLDAGESAAIAVARSEESVLLTDDLAAREAASEAGVEVRGSIGLVALGHARGLLSSDEAAGRMRSLQRETSLFVTESVVERGIQMIDQENKSG